VGADADARLGFCGAVARLVEGCQGLTGSNREALEYIHSLYRFGSRPGLVRMRLLLGALGRPHLGLKVIHIAGTNGKGSVAAMVASILSAAGYRTGLYISPYLSSFGERMSVDGVPISPEETTELVLGRVRPAVAALTAPACPSGGTACPAHGQDDQVVEFEATTALGFLYFARRRVDYLVAEVGLGGRFDATNVIDRPLLSIVTSIGLDHTDRLGATIQAIAAEKAGIIKRLVPVVLAPQAPAALAVLRATARRRSSPFFLAATAPAAPATSPPPSGLVTPRRATLTGQVIDFSGPGFPGVTGLRLPLLGPHQLDNAAAALTALGLLQSWGLASALDETALRAGLAATVWPGRFEVFGGPDDRGAARCPTIIVDGAHNPPGAKALAEALRRLVPGRRILLVLGLLGDKDTDGLLSALLPPALPAVAGVFTCRPASPRAYEAHDLARRVRVAAPGLAVTAGTSVAGALRAAVAEAGPSDVVCVAGSIYLLGEARAAARQAVAG
jgi:dihydrofolate synthase/folylpolyglutamate synthase